MRYGYGWRRRRRGLRGWSAGINASFPIVQFSTGDQRQISGNVIGPANSQQATVALLKFKFASLPGADTRIFGELTGAGPLQIFLRTTGTLEFRFVNSVGTIINRPETPVLTAGVEYDILLSIDNTQATAAAGANCYINGSSVALTNFNYTSGQATAWTVSAATQFNQGNITFDLGAFWLDTATRVDLTNSANRAKFTSLTSGNLDILADGSGITGNLPRLFFVGNAAQWNASPVVNRGSGPNLTKTSGDVADVNGGAAWLPPTTFAFVASSNASAGAAATSVTVATPAGAQAGDLLVAHLQSNATFTHNTYAGWEKKDGGGAGGVQQVQMGIHDGVTANYTFTCTGAAAQGVVLLCYRQAQPDLCGAFGSSTVDPQAPSPGTPAANAINLLFVGSGTAGTTYTAPAGWIQRGQCSTDRALQVFERDPLTAPAALPIVTATRSAGATNGRAVQATLKAA